MYKKKISPQEALQDILLRMKYDSSKTLNENNIILEQSKESNIAKLFHDSVVGPGTNPKKLRSSIEMITSADMFNKVNDLVKQKYGNLSIGEWIQQELESDNTYTAKFVIDHFKKYGITATAEFTPKGTLKLRTFKITLPKKQDQTIPPKKEDGTTPPKKEDGTTPPKKDGQNKKKVQQQKRSIPPELKNIENGVRKFQDWLDQNHKNWATGYKDGIINQGKNGGGYGTYGPRTQKMWLTKGVADEFLKFITKGSVTSKETPVVGGKETPVVGGKQTLNVVNTDNKPKSPQEIEDTY